MNFKNIEMLDKLEKIKKKTGGEKKIREKM